MSPQCHLTCPLPLPGRPVLSNWTQEAVLRQHPRIPETLFCAHHQAIGNGTHTPKTKQEPDSINSGFTLITRLRTTQMLQHVALDLENAQKSARVVGVAGPSGGRGVRALAVQGCGLAVCWLGSSPTSLAGGQPLHGGEQAVQAPERRRRGYRVGARLTI